MSGVESTDTSHHQSLNGKRIMLMEDDDRLYGAMKDTLEDFGCEILGSCARLCGPLDVVPNSRLDAALIDLDELSFARSTAIVATLQARGVPIVLITPLTTADLPLAMRACERLLKPFTCPAMLSGLAAVIAAGRQTAAH